MTIIHNHGAAISGTKSEKKLLQITKSLGFLFLRTRDEFESNGVNEWGARYHKPPSEWNQKTKTGKQRKYVSDGFIPITSDGRGIIIEQKHSDKHGTTEEKVFYDLKKIQKGVYGESNLLWYVFTGEASSDIEVYKEFSLEAKRLNLPVKIIWGFETYKAELQKIKERLYE